MKDCLFCCTNLMHRIAVELIEYFGGCVADCQAKDCAQVQVLDLAHAGDQRVQHQGGDEKLHEPLGQTDDQHDLLAQSPQPFCSSLIRFDHFFDRRQNQPE
eukprot:2905111-Rhodomonas_salina.2